MCLHKPLTSDLSYCVSLPTKHPIAKRVNTDLYWSSYHGCRSSNSRPCSGLNIRWICAVRERWRENVSFVWVCWCSRPDSQRHLSFPGVFIWMKLTKIPPTHIWQRVWCPWHSEICRSTILIQTRETSCSGQNCYYTGEMLIFKNTLCSFVVWPLDVIKWIC